MDKNVLKAALKASMPVILGYLPASFGFGLLITTKAQVNILFAAGMSVFIYAGAGQYIAVDFFVNNISYLQMAVLTFLVNSKHLFYGLSLLEEYKGFKKLKLYMMFSLTDETYAVLTSVKRPDDVDAKTYMFLVSAINQLAWITGTVLGALIGTLVRFNSRGIDFALTSLFFVILTDQLRHFKTKLPFVIGIFSALLAMVIFGKENMLLFGSFASVVLLIIFRKRIECYES